MDPIELDIHRKNTEAFIAVKPVEIALIPKTERVRTPGGGWTEGDAPPRPPQTFRVIELGMQGNVPKIRTQNGEERTVLFWLLGKWDAAMEVDDYWTEGNRVLMIGDIVRTNHYETRGVVVERGQ